MKPFLVAALVLYVALVVGQPQPTSRAATAASDLKAGFAETDITPKLGGKPVYLAGFGKNRVATAVHDPLKCRAVVLRHGDEKLALVSVDLVGLFLPNVERVRTKLAGFRHVLVSSTHNHDGPDTLGLWGPNPFTNGVDPDYVRFVEGQIVRAVQEADQAARPVTVQIGTTKAPELLHDGREPAVLHDDLVVLSFREAGAEKPVGILMQWNCHPETLGGKNTQVSADYVTATVEHLRKGHGCPVAYFTGTVGGLMTSLHVSIKDEKGTSLADGTFEKTERYGRLLGEATDRALKETKPIRLMPFQVRTRPLFVPMDNKGYQVARRLGILPREAFVWTGDTAKAERLPERSENTPLCIRTEVGWLQLGELSIAAIPGEIYPELVLGKVQDPADPGSDYPQAPVEPAIYSQMPGPHRMLIGLANDEIGYILPKRQWDEKPPFCYGRKRAQYGEENSVGPEVGPLLCRAFADLVKGKP